MNQSEYKSAVAGARRQWPKLTAKAMRKIKEAYTKAGSAIADILREGSITNGVLDFETQRKLDQAILEGSADIGRAIREEVPILLAGAAGLLAAIETEVMKDAMGGLSGKITAEGIEKLFTKISERSVITSLNTAWGDGLTFWGRVPNVSRHFGDDVVNLVRAAIDQGRDLGKIAADVNKYIKDGKEATISRWGERIAPDSSQLLKRVPKQVDYRALRLTRSELGRGLMETAKANGLSNPACAGLWDWVRTNSIDWGCNCPENAANSPYTYDNIPPYDHPNDMCILRQRLKDQSKFREDLRAWVNGGQNAELEAWYQNVYLSA